MKKNIIYFIGILLCVTYNINAEVFQHLDTWEVYDDARMPSGLSFNSETQLIASAGGATSRDKIIFLNSTGAVTKSFGSHGTGNGEFNWPAYIAVDPDDRIWVTDNFNHRLQIFDSTGAFLFTFGSQGNGTNQFDRPRAITFDGWDLYVTDDKNYRVQKFHVSGENVNWVTNWGEQGPFSGQFGNQDSFETPIGGIDVKGTNVFVVDGGNNRIQIFDTDGNFLRKFGISGFDYGEFYAPLGLKVDKKNRVWVTERGNERIQVFTDTGEFLFVLDDSSVFEVPFDPYDIKIHPDGTVYISELNNSKIYRFRDGQPYFAGLPPVKVGKEQQELSFVVLAVDPNDNNLFYSISNAPPGFSLLPENGTNWFRWTPDAGAAGVYQVGFHVYDDGSPIASNFAVVTVVISDTNHPPTISTSLPISPYSILEGQNIQFNIIMFDKDYDNLTLVSNGTPENAGITKINGTNYLFNWTPDFDAGSISGTDYPMTFWTVDNGIPNLSNSVSVTITVIGTNDPPRISPLTDTFLNENEFLSFNVTAFDPDGDNLSFAVSNAPLNSTFSAVNSTNYLFSWTPSFTDAGIYSKYDIKKHQNLL